MRIRQVLDVARPLLIVALLVIVGGRIVQGRSATRVALADDELQHMHFAWNLTQDRVPYRDFWDNHPPGLHYALARIIDAQGESSASFQSARRWMLVLAFPLVAGVFLLARTAFGLTAGLLAAGWASCSQLLLLKGAEIRPDALMCGSATLGIVLLCTSLYGLSSEPKRGVRRIALSICGGLLFGAATLLSTKALILFSVVIVALTANALRDRTRRRFVASCVICSALGSAIALCPFLIAESLRDNAVRAVRFVLLDNAAYPDRFNPWPMISATEPLPLILAAILGLIAVWRSSSASAAGAFVAWAAPLSVVALAIMPAPYLQSALIALPFVCVLAGHGTQRLVELPGELRSQGRKDYQVDASTSVSAGGSGAEWAVALGYLGLAGILPCVRFEMEGIEGRAQLAADYQLIDRMHSSTSPDDRVFDGRCLAVFRRQALFFPVLVEGILKRYERGHIQPPVRESLRAEPPTLVLANARLARLPREDRRFMDEHYIGLGEPWEWVLVPGWRFSAASAAPSTTPANVARFEVLLPGSYDVRTVGAGAVTIDGSTVESRVELRPGWHDITFDTDVAISYSRSPPS